MLQGRGRTGVLLGALAIGLAGFVLLTYWVVTQGGTPFDDPVREAFYAWRQPGRTTLMEAITYGGDWKTIAILCLLLLAMEKTRRQGILVTLAAVITTLVRGVTKSLVGRPRPEEIWHLIEEGGTSFPSGHAITSLAVYGLCFLLLLRERKNRSAEEKENRKTGYVIAAILCGFLSFAIGLSRIYLGVHYPSDVLAGWCFALATTSGILMGEKRLQKRTEKIGSSANDG